MIHDRCFTNDVILDEDAPSDTRMAESLCATLKAENEVSLVLVNAIGKQCARDPMSVSVCI